MLIGLEHYYDPSDYNQLIYHNRSTDTGVRIQQVIDDANKLMSNSKHRYGNIKEYQLLRRALEEQTVCEENGYIRLRTKSDGGMDSKMLQNPSDPDATYREKNGKQHRGYVANVTESAGEGGSIVTDYRYEQNTYSDSEFLSDVLKNTGQQQAEMVIVADGAYNGTDNQETAATKNIKLVTTELTGRETKDIYAEFEFTGDGKKLIKCAAGHSPKSNRYNEKSGQCRVSFFRDQCINCIHKEKCAPKIYKRMSVIITSAKSYKRAETQRLIKTDEYRVFGRFRNGVETIASTLRRKYRVDTMPVRGKTRTKLFFGFKIAALNFQKLFEYLNKPLEYA
jgi:hypothetical protein